MDTHLPLLSPLLGLLGEVVPPLSSHLSLLLLRTLLGSTLEQVLGEVLGEWRRRRAGVALLAWARDWLRGKEGGITLHLPLHLHLHLPTPEARMEVVLLLLDCAVLHLRRAAHHP